MVSCGAREASNASSSNAPDSNGTSNGGGANKPEGGSAAKPGEGTFVAYSQEIPTSEVAIEMVPIAGGTFMLGSAAHEAGRAEHEGPQVQGKVEPFWMGKYEIRWDEYDVWPPFR